jgi:glyoxylase-like metal-dependent hydrolase (beta-lactamase superfamily II)
MGNRPDIDKRLNLVIMPRLSAQPALSDSAFIVHRSVHVIIQTLPVGPLQTNCYLIGCEETLEGAVIDPGGDANLILEAAERAGLTIKYILNTHAHFDHAAANADLVERTGAPLALHPLDLPLLQQRGGADMWGIPVKTSPQPDLELEEGQVIQVGRLELQVLFTPGHTPGHVSFYEPEAGVVFDGDVLFRRGIGRTDLPGGDFNALMRSIKEKLFALPAETVVYSGHGPATTIGEEKWGNPWLR